MGMILRALPVLVVTTFASAQDSAAFAVPFAERAPAIDRERGVLSTAALGLADDRFRWMSARRDAARASARSRAMVALHRFADDALAQARAEPACAVGVHRAIDGGATVRATRPLCDGSAVAIVDVELGRLAEGCRAAGLPWAH